MLHSLLLRDSVAFRVDPPQRVVAGQPVAIVLRLTNRTERPIRIGLHGDPAVFNATVTHEGGIVVWRRLDGVDLSSALLVSTLEPADTLTFETRWSGRDAAGLPAAPGRYRVNGALPTDSGTLVTLPVWFEVHPPQ